MRTVTVVQPMNAHHGSPDSACPATSPRATCSITSNCRGATACSWRRPVVRRQARSSVARMRRKFSIVMSAVAGRKDEPRVLVRGTAAVYNAARDCCVPCAEAGSARELSRRGKSNHLRGVLF